MNNHSKWSIEMITDDAHAHFELMERWYVYDFEEKNVFVHIV